MQKSVLFYILFIIVSSLIPYASLAENPLEAKIAEKVGPITKVAQGETANFGISEKQRLEIDNAGPKKCGTYQLFDSEEIISAGAVSRYQQIILGKDKKIFLICEGGTVNVVMKK